MNVLRNIFIIGIAVSFYLLIVEWRNDYITPEVERQTNTAIQQTYEEEYALPEDIDIRSDINKKELPNDLEVLDLPQVSLAAEKAQPLAAEEDISNRYIYVQTDTLKVKIDLVGGDIVQAQLRKYPISIDQPDVPFVLLNNNTNMYVAQSGIVGVTNKDLDAKKGRPIYQSKEKHYQLTSDNLIVSLQHITDQGLEVTKKFSFKENDYVVGLSYEIDNLSKEDWLGRPYTYLKRELFPDPSETGFAIRTFLGAAYWSNENKYNKIDFDEDQVTASLEANKKILDQTFNGGWIGIIQHYFVTAWIPQTDSLNNHYYAEYLKPNELEPNKKFTRVGLSTETIKIPAGDSKTIKVAQLYMGPKIQSRLEDLADGLELSVDYGFLFFISNLLFNTLEFIHGLTGNWGWAIVLLTVLIKALFYMPSAVSYRSMANIRRISPELIRLREKYSEDKQQLSQEMMKLYKKEKVNPLGGCLPILLQMPVFIALYWTLLESVELRQAEFLFWIKDLSSMDEYFVLPLLMGVSMFIQTSLNPTPPDPMQAKVMKFMPVMFTFFFLFFPSGLVLYWLTNNILSIAQQWWITRSIEKETAN